MKTQRDLVVTTDSQQVIDSINHFYDEMLNSGNNAISILQAANNEPDNLLLQTYAAAFYLYAQEDAATTLAIELLQHAEKALRTSNLREKLTFYAVYAWAHLDYECAITLFTSILELFPQDILALKFAEWLFYCTGQSYQNKYFLALCEKCVRQNQHDPAFLASYSFAHELCGHYSEAKTIANQALKITKEAVPWAHHTLAHAYLLENDIQGGIDCLQRLVSSWNDVLPLLRGHNTWHLALFYVANRNEKAVLNLFPKIFGTMPDTVLEQLDAISLLWRMDLAGLPQDHYFTKIIPYLGLHPMEHYIAFNNAHFIYCLTRAGHTDLAEESLQAMAHYAASLTSPYKQYLWQTLALPLCQGINAFAQGQYQRACDLMEPVIENCFQLGGSDAQNEIYTQTFLCSLLKTNQKEKANKFFQSYLNHYRHTPLARYWFDE
ncbi:ATP-dependent transcriptional regulator [Legionella beliardensis]|uniref:Tetratricopeptide repeat protein 38 n=1 Tax=Legionella beliardensis TaxID=91822 RepID=A0A378HXF3_9GAMM|nr:tetratricopeptide repeat protein [Legionella beliardensis]STX27502.1 ATP-dependent transcriptional regulator [Legionella beliardensis]